MIHPNITRYMIHTWCQEYNLNTVQLNNWRKHSLLICNFCNFLISFLATNNVRDCLLLLHGNQMSLKYVSRSFTVFDYYIVKIEGLQLSNSQTRKMGHKWFDWFFDFCFNATFSNISAISCLHDFHQDLIRCLCNY